MLHQSQGFILQIIGRVIKSKIFQNFPGIMLAKYFPNSISLFEGKPGFFAVYREELEYNFTENQ